MKDDSLFLWKYFLYNIAVKLENAFTIRFIINEKYIIFSVTQLNNYIFGKLNVQINKRVSTNRIIKAIITIVNEDVSFLSGIYFRRSAAAFMWFISWKKKIAQIAHCVWYPLCLRSVLKKIVLILQSVKREICALCKRVSYKDEYRNFYVVFITDTFRKTYYIKRVYTCLCFVRRANSLKPYLTLKFSPGWKFVCTLNKDFFITAY